MLYSKLYLCDIYDMSTMLTFGLGAEGRTPYIQRQKNVFSNKGFQEANQNQNGTNMLVNL